MRLNHIDLYSPTPKDTAMFFIDGLGLSLVETRGKETFYRLSDDAGLVLVVSPPARAFGGDDQVSLNAQTYHIGFLLPGRDRVDILQERVKTLGYAISEPREQHGAYTSYVTIPGNIMVEIGHRPDA